AERRAHDGGIRAGRTARRVGAPAPAERPKTGRHMNIDLLIKMTNEIGEFFAGTAEAPEAARAVANHLQRYWEPRMRAQIISYFEHRNGAGLTELASSVVALMVAEGEARPPAGAAAQRAKT